MYFLTFHRPTADTIENQGTLRRAWNRRKQVFCTGFTGFDNTHRTLIYYPVNPVILSEFLLTSICLEIDAFPILIPQIPYFS